MKILKLIALLAGSAAMLTACSVEHEEHSLPNVESVEVGFMLPEEATRTSLDPDGMTTRWAPGDKLAVWAKDADGNFAFEGAQFAMRYYSEEFDHAYFASNISAMADGEYTYMLSYPMPTSTNGALATYTIPATQNGEYDGRYDVMLAEPVVEGALTAESKVELNTIMRHKMHALKITIPEGRNLYGQRFYRLEITFPCDVVGDMTIDVSDPKETAVYTNTSNRVVVENATGFDAGDDIWVFVLPGTVDGDVSYKVRGERRSSNTTAYKLQREMREGHVTPINMAIPTIYPYYTSLMLSIDQNNLGEDFNFFDVYDSNGTHMGKFERNAKNEYFIDYEGEFDADQYDNSTWRVVFDSEHAVVETTINLGDMTDYSQHVCWMNVPYLFYENFSTITTYNRDVVTGAQGTAVTAYDLSQSTYGLKSGWTGARTGGESGKAIRVGSRVDRVWGYTHTYGRLDSPAITGLKPDAMVDVTVSFNYSGGRDGDSGYSPRVVCGYTTVSGPIDGVTGSFSSDEDSWKGIDGYKLVPSISTSGSFSNISQSMSYSITDCTNAHRLSWQIRGTGEGAFISNGNQWMFIDNIKVQIVK